MHLHSLNLLRPTVYKKCNGRMHTQTDGQTDRWMEGQFTNFGMKLICSFCQRKKLVMKIKPVYSKRYKWHLHSLIGVFDGHSMGSIVPQVEK